MFLNYLRVTFRYLMRHKGYSIINVFGLAVGCTCCIMVMLFVRSEFSYDAFHTKANRLFRVWQVEKTEGKEFVNTVTSLATAPAIQSAFPEVAGVSRVYNFNTLVKLDNRTFGESVDMVDSSFFSLFDFELLRGDPAKPFPSPNSIILTAETKKKYFGNADALGKNLELQLGDNKMNFLVAGIVKKAPDASSIKFNFLIPFDNQKYLFRAAVLTNWFEVFTETYVLLKDHNQAAGLEKKFPSMMKQQLGQDFGKEEFNLHLQPITNIHLNTALPAGNLPTSDPKYSYILATIGILILLVACINFITLSVGQSASRALEVGVRKTLGADRGKLMRQFWGEAFFMTVLSFGLGLLLAFLLVAPFNRLTERELQLHLDLPFGLFCLSLVAVIAGIAGIYPAVVLSGFNPVQVLKGKLKWSSNGAGLLRKGLIIGQFVASIVMIICTMVIGRQMQFLQHRNLGYNKDQVIVVPTNKSRAAGYALAALYRAELLKNPEVISASAAVFSFSETPWATLGFSDLKKNYHAFQYNEIDPYFIPAMQISMQQGKGFEPGNTADLNNSIVVNEALIREYGIKDPIGKKFGTYSQQIVGVVKDFNYESLHTPVKPLVLSLRADTIFRQSQDVSFANSPQPRISIRMKAGDLAAHIRLLENAWKSVAPGQEFQYHFLDESLAAAYKQEQKSSVIVKLASLLSVFIACMGLFGLATMTVQQRTREIGIRKVMGAGILQIVELLSKEFMIMVAIAAIISFPVAWWAMHRWLADFAYSVPISWWIFLVAGSVALFVALATVSYHAFKAAFANPVKSLRTE